MIPVKDGHRKTDSEGLSMDAEILRSMPRSSLETIFNFFISIRSAKSPEELIQSLSDLSEAVFEKDHVRLLYCGKPAAQACGCVGGGVSTKSESNPKAGCRDKNATTSSSVGQCGVESRHDTIQEIVSNAVELAAKRGCLDDCKKQNDLCLVSTAASRELSDSSEQVFNSLLPYISDAFYRFIPKDNTQTEEPLLGEDVRLTPREKEVLTWVSRGKGSWEVGEIVGISERTVKFHLQNIYKKLSVVNRAQAVTKAIQYNVLAVE